MIQNLSKRLVLAAAVMVGVPVGLNAQAGINQDNTPYGTTSAEFLLLGAGARGAALGRRVREHRKRCQRALLQPGRNRVDDSARPDGWYL